jgi:hypothetical protein
MHEACTSNMYMVVVSRLWPRKPQVSETDMYRTRSVDLQRRNKCERNQELHKRTTVAE